MKFLLRPIVQRHDKIIAVKSLFPYYDGKLFCWPTILIENRGIRSTVSPIWDKHMFKFVLKRLMRKL